MAKVIVTVCLAFVMVAHLGEGSLVVNMVARHSALLDKWQPNVKEFAQTLTKTLGGSDELQQKVYDVITTNMAAQMDKLVMMGNGSNNGETLRFCCSCRVCSRGCTQCGRWCCCKGSGGCRCSSCATSMPAVELSEVDTSMMSARQLWAASTRQVLVQDLRSEVARYSKANNLCCQCRTCESHVMNCQNSDCCVSGSGCSCRTCATQTFLFAADKIDNPVALTPEAEKAVQEVGTLLDNLLLMMAAL